MKAQATLSRDAGEIILSMLIGGGIWWFFVAQTPLTAIIGIVVGFAVGTAIVWSSEPSSAEFGWVLSVALVCMFLGWFISAWTGALVGFIIGVIAGLALYALSHGR